MNADRNRAQERGPAQRLWRLGFLLWACGCLSLAAEAQPLRAQGGRPVAAGAPAQQNAKQQDAARAKRLRAQKTKQQEQRAANAKQQQGAKRVQQARQQAAKRTRVENARKQAAAGAPQPKSRAQAAREQAARTQAAEAQRIQAARQQAASQSTRRVKAARQQASENDAKRVRNARQQRQERIGSARRQMTEAEKKERLRKARATLSNLTPAKHAAAKRFLYSQAEHHQRLARLQRVEDVLARGGDRASLARVQALRAKELGALKALATEMRQVLSELEAAAVEDGGEIGTRRAAAVDSAARRPRVQPQSLTPSESR